MARIKTPNLRPANLKAASLGDQFGSVGEFIAAQRRAARMSLRQLAEQAGVSNPYLSQIEHDLRKPSAEVLQQLARALRISAEQLYVRAGILDPEEHRATSVEMAVLSDDAITGRQKRVLIDVYNSFAAENAARAVRDVADVDTDQPDTDQPDTDQPETEQEGEGVERAG